MCLLRQPTVTTSVISFAPMFATEVDEMVTQMMTKHENPATGLSEFSCTVCHKVMRTKRHMENHVETHIEGLSHLCDHCGKSFKTRNSRDKHKYTYHRDTGVDAWQ